MNLTLQEYQQASEQQKRELINYIERVRPDLRFDSFLTDCLYQLPRFTFSRLKKMHFIYIPGGKFNMGLSEAEEWAAREICDPPAMKIAEMRPVKEVELPGFLVAENPFLVRHGWCMQAYVQLSPAETHIEALVYCGDDAMYTEFKTAQALADELQAQLPNETQREYFCRGNTNTLFCFGNTFPVRSELRKWFNTTFDDLSQCKKNNFGIGGLFMTEWCTDFFRYNYASDKAAKRTRLLRGGGADHYAWRSDIGWDIFENDKDWVWCASAMRMRSTYLVDDTAGFRLVINLKP
jgi:formylglycine-generating enzyme required for sulfatase activity